MPFWRRRPVNPGPVMLLEPPDGTVTEPLQQYPFRPEADSGPDPSPSEEGDDAALWWRPRLMQGPDRTRPRPLVLRWLPPPGLRQGLRYDLLLGLDPDLSAPAVIRDLPVPAASLAHLFVDTDYFWRVVAKVGGEPVSESRTGRFRTHPGLPRWLRVPDITNARDLGGWPVPGGRRVRQGLLYRSSEMNGHHTLTPEGESILLRELGIRTDLDLRGEDEEPHAALPEEWVRYRNIPFLPYEHIAEPGMMAAAARIVGVLEDAEAYPVLMHCWAGADRAGTAAFLILGLLGVQQEDLEVEYELSSLSVYGRRSRKGRGFQALLRVMERFRNGPDDGLTRQVENYLAAAGVTAGTVARLRGMLLEPAPPPPQETPDW